MIKQKDVSAIRLVPFSEPSLILSSFLGNSILKINIILFGRLDVFKTPFKDIEDLQPKNYQLDKENNQVKWS
ncbi:MAG: hypothetical protein AAFQ20_14075, partial [Bacteroidota bacterium]